MYFYIHDKICCLAIFSETGLKYIIPILIVWYIFKKCLLDYFFNKSTDSEQSVIISSISFFLWEQEMRQRSAFLSWRSVADPHLKGKVNFRLLTGCQERVQPQLRWYIDRLVPSHRPGQMLHLNNLFSRDEETQMHRNVLGSFKKVWLYRSKAPSTQWLVLTLTVSQLLYLRWN